MFEYIFSVFGDEIIKAIAVIVGTVLGCFFGVLFKRWFDDKTKQDVAKIAVKFVEQVWKKLHGPEKLEKALELAAALLAKKGIKFNAAEMKILIEAVLADLNDAFNKTVAEYEPPAETTDVVVGGFAQ